MVSSFGLRGGGAGRAANVRGSGTLAASRSVSCLMSHVPPGRSHVSRLMSMRRFPFRQQRISARDPNAMLPSIGPQRGDEARAR